MNGNSRALSFFATLAELVKGIRRRVGRSHGQLVRFSEGRLGRIALEMVIALLLVAIALLSTQQGDRYLWFLGRREVSGAPDHFLTSYHTWMTMGDPLVFPDWVSQAIGWQAAPLWVLAWILVLSALVAHLVVLIGRRPTSTAVSEPAARPRRRWRTAYAATLVLALWFGAWGVASSAIQTSRVPDAPAPSGVFAISTTSDKTSQREWRGSSVYFPPTLVMDQDVKDNYFIFGLSVPDGQRPEISLWLPSAIHEDDVAFAGGAPNGTEALSGCGRFEVEGVRTKWGSLTRATCTITNGASRRVDDIGPVLDPDYRPIVIRLGGYPRFAWGNDPQGGRSRMAVAISDYPEGGVAAYDKTGSMPLSHLAVSDYDVRSSSISNVGAGGDGAAVAGMIPARNEGGALRLEPAVAVLASAGSVEVSGSNPEFATQIGHLTLFYGQSQPVQEWQAVVEREQVRSTTQIEMVNSLALILLGTGPFGAFVATRRRSA